MIKVNQREGIPQALDSIKIDMPSNIVAVKGVRHLGGRGGTSTLISKTDEIHDVEGSRRIFDTAYTKHYVIQFQRVHEGQKPQGPQSRSIIRCKVTENIFGCTSLNPLKHYYIFEEGRSPHGRAVDQLRSYEGSVEEFLCRHVGSTGEGTSE